MLYLQRCLRHLGTILSLTANTIHFTTSNIILASGRVQSQSVPPSNCQGRRIGIPDLPDASILEISAFPVRDYTAHTLPIVNVPGGAWPYLNFCNVSVSYTHPEFDDFVTIIMWLPLDDWNGRLQAIGGAGFTAGLPADFLGPAASEGYAVATTDGGHGNDIMSAVSARSWALSRSGQVNQGMLQDFASIAVGDLAVVGKQIVENFYGVPPRASYWNGCSTGGRQGLALAQKYPDAFDGIVAAAPVVYWPTLLVAEYWPQQVMNRLGVYPKSCEFEAIRLAMIKACDDLDGVIDGIVSYPELCNLDAMNLVGQTFSCDGSPRRLSNAAATVANAVIQGPRNSTGQRQWYGLAPGTPFFNASDPAVPGLVGTKCSSPNPRSCLPAPFPIPIDWIQLFVAKNPNFDLAGMTYDDYFSALQASQQEYNGIMAFDNPDLSAFKARGGKMISWHGLADQLVPAEGTEQYYNSVLNADPNADDFYRFFKAPGVAHCANGVGPLPSRALDAVVRWVEEGEAPETLQAFSQVADGTVRPLCPYPLRQRYVGGDPRAPTSFTCAGSRGTRGRWR